MQPIEFARMLGLDDILAGQNGVIRRDQAVAGTTTIGSRSNAIALDTTSSSRRVGRCCSSPGNR
jgi:hypothetical protein